MSFTFPSSASEWLYVLLVWLLNPALWLFVLAVYVHRTTGLPGSGKAKRRELKLVAAHKLIAFRFVLVAIQKAKAANTTSPFASDTHFWEAINLVEVCFSDNIEIVRLMTVARSNSFAPGTLSELFIEVSVDSGICTRADANHILWDQPLVS